MIFRQSRVWSNKIRTDFSGGENLQSAPELLEENQFLSGENFIITSDGCLQTRDGKVKVNTSSLGSGPVISAHWYTKAAGTKYLVVQHGDSLYSKQWDGNGQFTTFGAAIKSSLSTDKFRSVVWLDNLYLTNGTDNVQVYDGATCSDLGGTPPKSKVIKIYADRMWLVDGNTLRFCPFNTPTTWNIGDAITIRTGDGDKITAISPQSGPGMVIFKQNSVWHLFGNALTGSSPFWGLDAPIAVDVGCMGPDCVSDAGVFLSRSNLFHFDLNSVQPFRETHTSVFQAKTLTEKQNAVVTTYTAQRMTLLSLAGRVYCVDHRHSDAITTWTGLNAQSFVVLDDKDDTGDLLIGDASLGIVYRYSGTDDDGVQIDSRFNDAYRLFGIAGEKEVKYIQPYVKIYGVTDYSVEVNCDPDFNSRTLLEVCSGSYPYTGWIWDTSHWDEAVWNESEFTISETAVADLIRGVFLSVGVRAMHRIKLIGFKAVIREVGIV